MDVDPHIAIASQLRRSEMKADAHSGRPPIRPGGFQEFPLDPDSALDRVAPLAEGQEALIGADVDYVASGSVRGVPDDPSHLGQDVAIRVPERDEHLSRPLEIAKQEGDLASWQG